MQLDIGDVEKVTGTNDFFRRNAHKGDTSGVAADFGSPEAEQLFVLLHALAVNGGGGPFEVHNTIDLDGGLAQQVHPGKFVDRDRLGLLHSRNVLLISRPLESGPLNLLLGLGITLGTRASSEIVGNERTQGLSGNDIPDDDVLSFFLVGQNRVTLLNLNGARGPGGEIVLAGRELDQLHKRVRELLLLRESRATPELNTLRVDRGEVGTLGGPLDEQLRPVGTIDNILGRVVLVVPEDADLVAAVEGELVTSVGVGEPRAEVLLLLKGFDSGGLVFLVDTSFTTVAVNIHQFVDSESVLLVEGDTVQGLHGSDGLFGSLIFDEGETATQR